MINQVFKKYNKGEITKIIKSLTPIEFLLLWPIYNKNTHPFYLFTVINLFFSSIANHSTITYYNYNYNNKIVNFFYNYDKFSILLISSFFVSNYKYLSIIVSLLLTRYEKLKDLSVVLTVITNLYNKNWIAPPFILPSFYSYKKRIDDKEWTLKNKLLWHTSMAFYICLCSYKYKI